MPSEGSDDVEGAGRTDRCLTAFFAGLFQPSDAAAATAQRQFYPCSTLTLAPCRNKNPCPTPPAVMLHKIPLIVVALIGVGMAIYEFFEGLCKDDG